jgi:hypothetical protein
MELLNKILLILKKKRQLTEVRAEHNFFRTHFADTLEQSEDDMRKEMSEIRGKNKQSDDDVKRAIELEKEISKYAQIKGRILASEQVEKELVAFIKSIKLWR